MRLLAGSLALLITAATVAGIGQGVSFRAGLAALNAEAEPSQRAEVASTFFVVAYLAISLPVIGVGTWITFNVAPDVANEAPLVPVMQQFFARGGARGAAMFR